MRAAFLVALALTPQESPSSTARPRWPLAPAGSLLLPGVEGRIDHLAVDLARERLFVAALGNDSVEVLDLRAKTVLKSLRGPAEPQGILYLADRDRMVVACGRTGTCDVYDGGTLERVMSVEVGDDADNLRYDARTKRVYVAYGEGALAILDAEAWKPLGRIALEGHPESFQLDPEEKRAFVNVPGAEQVAVVDLEARTVTGTWPIEEARANYPLAWVPGDAAAPRGLLLVGCRSPARFLVRDAASGAQVAALELSGDTDDVFYDARRRRAYVACGAGSVDVFERDEAGAFRPLVKVPTAPGARTCLYSPERDQLFVAVPKRGAQLAEVRVFAVLD